MKFDTHTHTHTLTAANSQGKAIKFDIPPLTAATSQGKATKFEAPPLTAATSQGKATAPLQSDSSQTNVLWVEFPGALPAFGGISTLST